MTNPGDSLVLNISNSYASLDAPGLQLNDYEVCRLLTPYMLAASATVEAADLLVGRLEIRPMYVRAYPLVEKSDAERAQTWPTFVQKDLPKGLYEACLDFSAGPPRPFPEPVIDPRVKAAQEAFTAELQNIAFPASSEGATPQYLVMSAQIYSDITKSCVGRLDINAHWATICTGFVGTLHEGPGYTGRTIQLWIERNVPSNRIVTSWEMLPGGTPKQGALHRMQSLHTRLQSYQSRLDIVNKG